MLAEEPVPVATLISEAVQKPADLVYSNAHTRECFSLYAFMVGDSGLLK